MRFRLICEGKPLDNVWEKCKMEDSPRGQGFLTQITQTDSELDHDKVILFILHRCLNVLHLSQDILNATSQ